MENCQKYVYYDFDPELFEAFLKDCKLTFGDLVRMLPFAVNHDTNIRRVIEQGLAFQDFIKSEKDASTSTSCERNQGVIPENGTNR